MPVAIENVDSIMPIVTGRDSDYGIVYGSETVRIKRGVLVAEIPVNLIPFMKFVSDKSAFEYFVTKATIVEPVEYAGKKIIDYKPYNIFALGYESFTQEEEVVIEDKSKPSGRTYIPLFPKQKNVLPEAKEVLTIQSNFGYALAILGIGVLVYFIIAKAK